MAIGRSVHSLPDLARGLDVLFERHFQAGMVAVKTGVAYQRTL